MKKGITKLITLCIIAILGNSNTLNAQNSRSWSPIFEKEIKTQGERVIIPHKYKTFQVSNDFKTILFSAPNEKTVDLQNSNLTIELPMPNGTLQRFRVVESPVMEPELAIQFPSIKTFNVVGIDEPGTYGKLDWTEFGFHGMILSPTGRIFIDPYSRNNITDYITYYTADFEKEASKMGHPECGGSLASAERNSGPPPSVQANIFSGTTLRTYRFAVACTGEYAVAATGVASPTTAQILSVVTTSVNRVDGVYETEAAIKLVLVATETSVLFGNAATDPFTGNNNSNTLITESQTVITSNIGSANYDIGHTFSTGGGGLAGLGVVCNSTQKARGITGSPSPVGDAYDIDFVAHEVGHEFSGNHSYNQCTGNATQNAGTMVEPLSGITIMGYAGVCATADNLSAHSIAYFHTISFDEVMTFSNTGGGNSCPVKTTTTNSIPVVTGSTTYTIPKSTPFTLTGSATDANAGDVLTYSWEEIDNNSTAHAGGTAAPYFRSFSPVSIPSRTFPQLATILTGATSNLGEYLPATAGTLNFRLTARDNKMGGGGVSYAGSQVVISTAGPFSVSYPTATGITWASGSTQTVTWNVNSTNAAPVNCANVNILLSTDGGNTFPTVILTNTPNDGTQAITVPSYATNKTTCRIKVESVGNIFFDISDNNFTITATTSPIATVAIAQTAGTNPMCPGASATFSATPTNGGTTPSYQWQVNGVNAGTNSNTFTTTTLTNGQSVTCIMTSNLAGVVNSPATSNLITMTVGNTTPVVTIAGPTVLCAGASSTYIATPTNGGSAPTYQWQVNAVNAGTNSATFTTSTLTNGQAVTCIMTSNAGCQSTPTVTSNTVTVTVNSPATTPFVENFEGATFPPTGWVLQNADAPSIAWNTAGAKGLERRAAAGNTGSATGSAGIEFFNYNTDTSSIDNLVSKPVSLSGAASAKMTFKRAYKYYNDATTPQYFHDELRVYVSTDCGSTYSSALYFKKGVQLATNGTINTTFTPSVAADWDTDTVDLTAYINQNVIVKFETTNRFGNNLYLDDINITSTAAAGPPVANFTAGATKCAGTAIAFTDASTNTPTSWVWTTTPTTGVTITSANSQNPNITFTTAGTYTVSLVSTNVSGSSPSFTQAVTVNAAPAMTSATTSAICSGAAVNIPLTSSIPSSYSWIAANNANTTGESITAQATATINNTITNATTSAQTVTYSVTPTATTGGCVGAVQTVSVTVNPTPTMTNAATASVCSGTPLAIALTSNIPSSYSWITTNNANTTGESTTAQTTGTINNTIVNTVATAQTLTYSVTPTSTASACVGTVQTITVTVNVLPTVTATSAPVSGTVCSGASVTLTGGGANTYTWTGGVTNATAFTATATTTYTVTGTTTATGCSNTTTKVITVNNAPVMTSATTANVCSGAAVSVPLTSDITATYSWIAANNANTTGESTTTQSTSTINNTLTNTTTSTQTVSYSVTPTAGGCVGAIQTVSVNVIPAPTMTNAATASVCSGTPLAIALTSNIPSSYSWIAANNANTTGESLTAQATGTINNTIINSTATPKTVTYSVTPTSTAGSCAGTTQVISVTVNALPTVTATSAPVSGTVCSGASVTLTGGGANTYTWTGGVTNATAFTATATTTYTVTGTTTTTGCSNTTTKTITVNSLPTVTATASPISATVCAGTQVTLTGGGATTYTWSGGVTNATAFTPASSLTYTVTGTDANGCTSTSTKSVTVNALPSVIVNSPSTCAGAPTTLTGNGASTYSWSTGETTASISVTTATNTSYTVTGTDANGCVNTAVSNVTISAVAPVISFNSSSVCSGVATTLTASGANTFAWSTGDNTASINVTLTSPTSYTVTGSNGPGCSSTSTVSIGVNPLPTVTASSNPSNGTVCTGSQLTLTGGGANTYTWSGGANDGVAFAPAGSATYTVTGTDINGCTNTATQSVTVNLLPTVTVNSPSTCSGVSTTLIANGASTFIWSNSLTGSSISVSPTVDATYTVTGTDANGCVNTAVSNVTITAAPNVTVNSQTICAGQSTTLTGNGATSFTWNTGDATAAITVNPTGTTSYTVTGSNGAGCQNTAVATVTVNNLPLIGTTSSASSTVCSGSGVTLTATGATSYSWNTGDVTDIISVNPAATATYTATGTDANGCSNTSNITVNVFPVNTPTVSQTGNTLTASGATSYQWYLDGNLIAGETNSTITATQNGSYTVVTTDANGCTATSAAVVVNGIGIKEVTNSVTINIYPNPTNGVFAVELSLDSKNDYTIEISDVLGQIIHTEKTISAKSFNKNYDFSNESNGVYFITIQGTDKSKSVKRIVLNK